jgi:hypothetical protein
MATPKPISPHAIARLGHLSRLYDKQHLPSLGPEELAQDDLGLLALGAPPEPLGLSPEEALGASKDAGLAGLTDRASGVLGNLDDLASLAALQADHPGLAESLASFGQDSEGIGGPGNVGELGEVEPEAPAGEEIEAPPKPEREPERPSAMLRRKKAEHQHTEKKPEIEALGPPRPSRSRASVQGLRERLGRK